MSYYYFAASLPSLALEDPLPVSHEEFRARCGEHLSAPHLAAVDALSSDDAGNVPHPFVRLWRDRETQLRNALVRVRASRHGRDASAYLREQDDVDTAVDKAAGDAYARATPREREMALDRFRWTQAEALAGLDAFSIQAILAYSVKLKLCERWAGMDETEGRNRADAIVAGGPATEGE